MRETTQTVGPDHAKTFASMGPLKCVMFSLSKALIVEAWGKWCVGTEDDVHGCFQGTLAGGLLKSLCGTRKAAHNWEKKWQKVLVGRSVVTSDRVLSRA